VPLPFKCFTLGEVKIVWGEILVTSIPLPLIFVLEPNKKKYKKVHALSSIDLLPNTISLLETIKIFMFCLSFQLKRVYLEYCSCFWICVVICETNPEFENCTVMHFFWGVLVINLFHHSALQGRYYKELEVACKCYSDIPYNVTDYHCHVVAWLFPVKNSIN